MQSCSPRKSRRKGRSVSNLYCSSQESSKHSLSTTAHISIKNPSLYFYQRNQNKTKAATTDVQLKVLLCVSSVWDFTMALRSTLHPSISLARVYLSLSETEMKGVHFQSLDRKHFTRAVLNAAAGTQHLSCPGCRGPGSSEKGPVWEALQALESLYAAAVCLGEVADSQKCENLLISLVGTMKPLSRTHS